MTNTTHSRNTANRRLQRIHEDRILAGVSTGLGDYLDINAWWIRLAFIILTVFGGAGFLIYIAAWLVIPDERDDQAIITGWMQRLDTSDGGVIFGFVLIGASALVVLTQIADVSGAIVVAVILFVAGLLLYRGDILVPKQEPTPPAPTGSDDATDGPTDDEQELDRADGEAEDAGVASSAIAASVIEPAPPAPPVPPAAKPVQRPPRPPRPPRERSMLGRLTIAVGLIVIASMALLDLAFESIDVEPVHYMGAAVATVGLGLLVGSWMGKARWLILVGFLLLPALWFTSYWPDSFDWSAGDRTYDPIAVEQVSSPYELGMGSLKIDLRGMSAEDLAEVGSIEASIGMGELIIWVPEDVRVAFTAEVGMGEIAGPFPNLGGIGLEERVLIGEAGLPLLEIHAEAGAGTVQLRGEDGLRSTDWGSWSHEFDISTSWRNS